MANGTVKMVLEDFIGLLFPNNCVLCNERLNRTEEHICIKCLFSLPKTHFHQLKDNEVYQRLSSRYPIAHGCSLFFFDKGGNVQSLIHHLKYHGLPEIGHYLGNILGNDLKESAYYADVDWVLGVPLHAKKQKLRGYNQAACFAQGIAQGLGCNFADNWLSRVSFTDSQTGKNKFERWENVKNAFCFHPPQQLSFRHLLVVDDVVTTGATLEACLMQIPKNSNFKVSVATIAFAHD